MGKMNPIFAVSPESLISALSQHIKNEDLLTVPKHALFSKTCSGKENAPLQRDWLYTRAAAILRIILKGDTSLNNVTVNRGLKTFESGSNSTGLNKKFHLKNEKLVTITTLASKFGCKKDRGTRPGKKVRAYKSFIISIVNDFKKLNWIKNENGAFFPMEEGVRVVSGIV